MIKIPVCFGCKNYKRDNGACPAFPDGVPDNVLFDKKEDKKECGNGACFEDCRKIPKL